MYIKLQQILGLIGTHTGDALLCAALCIYIYYIHILSKKSVGYLDMSEICVNTHTHTHTHSHLTFCRA